MPGTQLSYGELFAANVSNDVIGRVSKPHALRRQRPDVPARLAERRGVVTGEGAGAPPEIIVEGGNPLPSGAQPSTFTTLATTGAMDSGTQTLTIENVPQYVRVRVRYPHLLHVLDDPRYRDFRADDGMLAVIDNPNDPARAVRHVQVVATGELA